jgi:hypothetical protein
VGWYTVEDWFVELEVLLLNLPDGGLHLLFNLPDDFVSLVDGDGLHLVWEREVLDALFNLLQGNLSLFLTISILTKKSNISTMLFDILLNCPSNSLIIIACLRQANIKQSIITEHCSQDIMIFE